MCLEAEFNEDSYDLKIRIRLLVPELYLENCGDGEQTCGGGGGGGVEESRVAMGPSWLRLKF